MARLADSDGSLSRRSASGCRLTRKSDMSERAANPYETGLDKNAANYVPLSPIGFLRRSAEIYPRRTAVVYGERRQSWQETRERCRRLASALAAHGVGPSDTVTVMAPNLPEHFEAHFAVPM